MLKKKVLGTAVAVAMGAGAGQVLAGVNIDNNAADAPDNYANEIAVSAAGTVLQSAAAGPLDATTQLGFSITTGSSVFVRYDLSGAGAAFNTQLVPADITAGAATVTISAGGAPGDTFVIFELTAGAANIPNTTNVVFSPNDVRVTSKASANIRYRLYSDAVAANNATTSTLKDQSSTYFGFLQGYNVACTTTPAPLRIDVVNPQQFIGSGTTTNVADTVSVNAVANVFTAAGTAVDIVTDYFPNGSAISITGSTTAFGNANGFTLAGQNAAAAPANGTASWATGAAAGAGVVVLPLAQPFAVNADGATAMVPSSYQFSIDGSAGTFNIGTIAVPCGELKFSGSTDRLDFALTPNGVFRQFVRVTNPSNVTGAVTVTVTNDAGTSVTFDLGAINGITGNSLAAGASTALININDVFAAAQATNAAFGLASGTQNKLRVEVRGEFGDDALDNGGNTVTDRRTDGIHIQAVTLSQDNNAFFQTK